MYYMEAANRENTDGNPPPPESPSDEDGKDGPQTRGKGNAGAYSTGAAKYRKNRGKVRVVVLCTATGVDTNNINNMMRQSHLISVMRAG